jgi:hypothetical protein
MNYVIKRDVSGLLRNPLEPGTMECCACQRAQKYDRNDLLPIIPKRSLDNDWGGGIRYSVYLIVNSANNLIYVGRTSRTLHERMADYEAHCRRLKPNMITSWSNPILLAMAEIGFKAFDMILLEEVCDLSLPGDREHYWISRLNACNPLKGYNRATRSSFD